MIGKFIYVFDEDSRDMMLAKHYKLMSADDKKGIYVFQNKVDVSFAATDIKCVYSDTLTF